MTEQKAGSDRVGLATSPLSIAGHRTGPYHPETHARIRWIMDHLASRGITQRISDVPSLPAERAWIETVHDRSYVDRVFEACSRGDSVIDSMDTEIAIDSGEAALQAAGAALALCDAVATGRADSGFAPVRPPGHHAERALSMGFCLFNNVAIAARYLQQKHGVQRVLIVDWDVHHGNGTQNAFYEDRDVFYFSTHQFPLYPGTGSSLETGIGKGKGTTLNVPMGAGSGDPEYRRAFAEKFVPAALAFRPEAILISAGFDAHAEDPLSGTLVTDAMYGEMTRTVLRVAREVNACGVVSLLEGGYSQEALPRCVGVHLEALLAGAGE